MQRLILHCDLNNFYASVEGLLNPELKNVPLAVSGNPTLRHGVVLAKNELAKKFGVKTGDVIWQARQKCPDIVFAEPHFNEYMYYSRKAFDIYTRFTCYVEPFGADECWLDVSGSVKLFGDGLKIANTIRKTIREEMGITASVGVSFNKTFAKLGSDMRKPDATTVIDQDNFRERIWPLKVQDMIMVGRSTTATLKKINVHTLGDLARADDGVIQELLGKNGLKLLAMARGEECDPVREAVKAREIKSIGHGMTTRRDVTNDEDLITLIDCLSEMIATRMRKHGVKGFGVSVNLRYNDLTHKSKQVKLPNPIYATDEIARVAMDICKSMQPYTPLRTLTISIFDLMPIDQATQMCMFDDEIIRSQKSANLDIAIANIRNKYGCDKIKRANLIATDFIYDKNEAEDFLPFQR